MFLPNLPSHNILVDLKSKAKKQIPMRYILRTSINKEYNKLAFFHFMQANFWQNQCSHEIL